MSGVCSKHQGECPPDCHITGERKLPTREMLDSMRAFAESPPLQQWRVYGVTRAQADRWIFAADERERLQAEVGRLELELRTHVPMAVYGQAESDCKILRSRLAKIEELARVAEHYSSQVKPLLDFILRPDGGET